jgi:hypothetical protein
MHSSGSLICSARVECVALATPGRESGVANATRMVWGVADAGLERPAYDHAAATRQDTSFLQRTPGGFFASFPNARFTTLPMTDDQGQGWARWATAGSAGTGKFVSASGGGVPGCGDTIFLKSLLPRCFGATSSFPRLRGETNRPRRPMEFALARRRLLDVTQSVGGSHSRPTARSGPRATGPHNPDRTARAPCPRRRSQSLS